MSLKITFLLAALAVMGIGLAMAADGAKKENPQNSACSKTGETCDESSECCSQHCQDDWMGVKKCVTVRPPKKGQPPAAAAAGRR